MKIGSIAIPKISYDCRSWLDGSNEGCSVAILEPNRVYVAVHAYAGFNGLTFTCTVTVKYTAPITNMTLSINKVKHYYMDVGANQAVYCSTNGASGNADLYMKIGGSIAIPNNSYDCRSLYLESNERCSVAILEPNRVYVAVHAYAGFNGLAFNCTVRSMSAPTFTPRLPPHLHQPHLNQQ
jgi:hypothetical protein